MAQVEAIGAHVPHAHVHALDAGGHSPHRDAQSALDEVIAQFILAPRVGAASA